MGYSECSDGADQVGQSRMRGWSSDGDHQTPMDSVGQPVRDLQAEEQPSHISGAGTNAGCECLPLSHLWFLLSSSHFPTVESQGLSLTAKMKINPALFPMDPTTNYNHVQPRQSLPQSAAWRRGVGENRCSHARGSKERTLGRGW